MNASAQTQLGARLFEASAKGDVTSVCAIMSGMSSVDVRDDRGWTALMMAARKGHLHVVRALLDKGCDTEIINSSGQTAKTIAAFWNYPDVVNILDKSPNAPTSGPPGAPLSASERPDDKNFFAKEFLDRAAHRRKDDEWLGEVKKMESTTYVLFNNDMEALVTHWTDHSATQPKGTFRLYRARYSQVKDHLEPERASLLVFLGVDRQIEKESGDEKAWFALRVADVPGVSELDMNTTWLGALPGSLQLDPRDSGVFAHARSVLAWHDRNGFCATCGRATRPAEGGHKRECADPDCRSTKGVHNTCYPRVDPTVIMAVICPEGRRLLLGRSSRFPRGMYSCLAGFVEPGETLEAACRREVQEEVGVQVGRVQYHSCQPWPMPASLMVGCMVHATSEHLQVDKDELEDARWFSRHDVISMLNNRHPERLFVPPEQAIAHVLIRTWVNMTSNL